MRFNLIIISLLFVTTNLFSQKTKKQGSSSSWRDTTFIPVVLNDTIKDNKVVVVDIGKKATIYLNLKPMLLEAKENLSNDFVKEYYQTIIHYFDSSSLKGDTTFIENYYNLRHFEYLVSRQLIDGNAKVYYKKQKAFIDTITHRLERYGGDAVRFFYLADRRPFFAAKEFSGILDNEDEPFRKGRFDEYVNEGEKLQSLRKE
jgi:hypothetical protein